jgi:hypothetical protein
MAGPTAGSTRSRMIQSGHAQPIFAVMHNTALAQRKRAWTGLARRRIAASKVLGVRAKVSSFVELSPNVPKRRN